MKIHNAKFNRKDPLNPILGTKKKDLELRSLSNNKYTYDLGSSNQNSSYLKNTNNSTNKIYSNKQISIFSDILNENKRTSFTNNNITQNDDNIFSYLNNNKNIQKKNTYFTKKKNVRFLDSEQFVQIILVESHKKYHKIDNIYDDARNDIIQINNKKLKNESIKKDPKNKNAKNIDNDKACKCLIF